MDTLAILAGVDSEGGGAPSLSVFSAEHRSLSESIDAVGFLALLESMFLDADLQARRAHLALERIEDMYGKAQCITTGEGCFPCVLRDMLVSGEEPENSPIESQAIKIAFIVPKMKEVLRLEAYPAIVYAILQYEILKEKTLCALEKAFNVPASTPDKDIVSGLVRLCNMIELIAGYMAQACAYVQNVQK